MRNVVPESCISGIVVFCSRTSGVIAKNATARYPSMSIARVAVKYSLMSSIFGDLRDSADQDIVSTALTVRNTVELNGAMQSKIEFWDSDRWR